MEFTCKISPYFPDSAKISDCNSSLSLKEPKTKMRLHQAWWIDRQVSPQVRRTSWRNLAFCGALCTAISTWGWDKSSVKKKRKCNQWCKLYYWCFTAFLNFLLLSDYTLCKKSSFGPKSQNRNFMRKNSNSFPSKNRNFKLEILQFLDKNLFFASLCNNVQDFQVLFH